MDYPLQNYARFLEYKFSYEQGGVTLQGIVKYGIQIACPNCGREYSALFKNPIGAAENVTGDKYKRPQWDRAGDTLEIMTLSPSFLAFDCYHSWIHQGILCIDSPFKCAKKVD